MAKIGVATGMGIGIGIEMAFLGENA